MVRTRILGIGSHVPDRVVRNDEIGFLNDRHERCDQLQTDTSDDWIRARSGIEERRYAGEGVSTSDLALVASQAALRDAGVVAGDVDCIVLATLSPDIHFPGTAVFLQDKLGISAGGCACYDIRQQCSGFVYGLQLGDALVRSRLYRRVLLVGAEIHSHSLDFSTRGRNVTVLFGDGAGAFLLGPVESEDPREGVIYTECRADGSGAWDLYLKIFDMGRAPYLSLDDSRPDAHLEHYPQMEGKRVFVQAVRRMAQSAQRALAECGLGWNDVDWFVPHQANLRINQKVVEVAGIPEEKALNSIQLYGNTTAATVPLTLDHWRKAGRVERGDLVLSTVFGSGYTWGSAIFRI